MGNKQIIPTALGMSYEEIENLNGVRPYDFDTERERKWYEIGLIDGKEAADVKHAKFAAYEDKTYITAEFLVRNGFVLHEVDEPDHEFASICRDRDYYLYCDDCVEISAELSDEEAGIWAMEIKFLDHGDTEELNICTLGQFRMFLAICGLDNIVEQFK